MERDIKKSINKPLGISERTSGLAFSFAVVLVMLVSLVFSIIVHFNGASSKDAVYIYFSYFLPCVSLLFAILATVFVSRSSFGDITAYFKFRIDKKFYFLIIPTAIGVLFGLGELNELFIKFLGLFGYVDTPSYLPEYSPLNLILTIVVIAVLPPVLEETLFRGIVQNGLKKSGYISIIVTAALFAVYHLSPSKTLYQFAVGLILSLVALKSGSVVPTIIIHFLNNLLVILNEYFSLFSILPAGIARMAVGLICLAVAFALLFVGRKPESFGDTSTKAPSKPEKTNWFEFVKGGVIGLVLSLAVWIANLFA